ncbi:TPA: FimD/PapC C-terminal domain-containing protein [Escherichia coli]
MATLEQLIIFFLLIGVGVIARKVGVITPGNTPQLTSLVFNFAMPAIILSGITTEQPHISGKDLSIVLTSAFTTLILLIICSRMLARILRYEYGNKSVPFGAIVTHGENKNGSIVAENGQVYLTGLPQSGKLQVSWGNDKNSNCIVEYKLPEVSPGTLLNQQTAICR